MYKRFIVKKKIEHMDSYRMETVSIPVGSEITIYGETMYFNGGLMPPLYTAMFRKMLSDPKTCKEYFREVPIPYNKA